VKVSQWLQNKDVTLALSAGFFGFYSHAGFLAGLLDSGFRPAKLTGTSAGAIVAALYASGHSATELKQTLLKIQRKDFWDPALGPGLLRGKKFENLLRDYVQDDFSRLQVPVHISTFDLKTMRTKIYSKEASVVTAVRASASFPGLFRPVFYDRSLLIDGGVADEWAMQAVGPDEHVINHFLLRGKSPARKEQKMIHHHGGEKRKIYFINDRVSVAPWALDQGVRAFDQGYLKATEFLDSPI
jgi:NTE family protein